MALSSDVIFFGIQAVLKLNNTAKEAQIAQIKRQSLKLRLPNRAVKKANFISAKTYFVQDATGRKQLETASGRVKTLVNKARRGNLDDVAEQNELVEEYYKIRNLCEGHVEVKNAEDLQDQQLFALMHIQQWENNPSTASPLQAVVGSLIDLGVDLLQLKPDLINTNTSQGQLMKSFLSGLDNVDFANTPTNQIVSNMMSTTVELLDNGDLLGGDASTQEFLRTVTKGVATDISSYIQTTKSSGSSNLQKEDDARVWGTTIFRSIVQHAGTTALGNPVTFLGTDEKNTALIQTVGNSLLDVVLNDVVAADGEKINLKGFLSQSALDTMTQASVNLLAEYPEWYDFDNEGLKNIVTGLVQELNSYPVKASLDMLPNLVNSLLTLTAGNLEVIYQGDASKPANNLLLVATRSVLSSLQSAVPTDGNKKWQPIFTKTQTVDLIDSVMQAVIAKPEWLLNKVSDTPILEDTLASVLSALNGISVANLNGAARLDILKSVIASVAVRQDLINKLDIGGEQKNLLSASLSMVLDLAFGDKADAKVKWALINNDAASMLINATLQRVAQEGASEEVLGLVQQFLEGEFSGLKNGENFSLTNLIEKLKSPDAIQVLLANSLDAATRITSQLLLDNPQILNIENEGIKNIINGLATTLKDYPDQVSKELLPDLAQSVLGQTANNLDFLFPGDRTNIGNNLLFKATTSVLNALSTASGTGNGNSGIVFSKAQLTNILDFTVQEVIAKPDWILAEFGDKPILQATLSAALSAIQGVKISQLNNDACITIFKSTLTAVSQNQALLTKIPGGQKPIVSTAISMTLNFAFGEKVEAKAQFGIVSNEAVGLLTGAVLTRLAAEGASETTLTMINEFMNSEVLGIEEGELFSLNNLVQKLSSRESLQLLLANSADQITRIAAQAYLDHPNIVKLKNEGVKNIVTSLANSLAKFPDKLGKSSLSELTGLVISSTAQNFNLIYKNGTANPSNNFVLKTIDTLVNALVQEDGTVGLSLDTMQLTDVSSFLIDQAVQKPDWVITKIAGDNTMMQAVLTATLETINSSSFTGLNAASTTSILKSAMNAAGTRIELIDNLPIDDGAKQTIISAALDIVFDTASGSKDLMTNLEDAALVKIKWVLSDNATVSSLADAVLRRMAKEGGNPQALEMTKQLMMTEATRIAKGEPFSLDNLLGQLTSTQSLEEILASLLSPTTETTTTDVPVAVETNITVDTGI